MRKYFLLIGLYISLGAFSQMKTVLNYQEIDERWIHFGFVLGFNTCDFDFKLNQLAVDTGMYVEVPFLNPGFHVGIISNLRLNDYMDLRALPGMSFGSRKVYYYKINGNGNFIIDKNTENGQRIDYYPIEIPLILKLKAERLNNYRPYLITNFTCRFDMSSSKKFSEDDTKELPRYIIFKPFNYYYGFGVGIDYYFEFFKLSTEIRMDFGQRDILKHDEPHGKYPIYTNIIDKVKSNIIYLSFCFE